MHAYLYMQTPARRQESATRFAKAFSQSLRNRMFKHSLKK